MMLNESIIDFDAIQTLISKFPPFPPLTLPEIFWGFFLATGCRLSDGLMTDALLYSSLSSEIFLSTTDLNIGSLSERPCKDDSNHEQELCLSSNAS